MSIVVVVVVVGELGLENYSFVTRFLCSYEERKRSLETVSSRHKDSNTYEDFAARIYTPVPPSSSSTAPTTSSVAGVASHGPTHGHAPLAAALIDHHPHLRASGKS